MTGLALGLCFAFAPTSAFAQGMPAIPGMPAMPAMPAMPTTTTTTTVDGQTVGQTASVEGQPFLINGMNQAVSHACGSNGSPDVIVNGMGGVITLTGDCGEVIVNGAQMKVTMGVVTKLTIGGMGNVVTYASGPAGAKVEVVNPVPGNTVTQTKP